ncbi:MAG: hypothetical protein IPK26_07465 [Planctomycetes bacterium]|nr:hypothetical protein [Planctomycetota bacterium]
MGIYDRDYMRVDRNEPGAYRSQVTPLPSADGSMAVVILVAVAVVQAIAWAIPTSRATPWGRDWSWFDAFGVAGFDPSLAGFLLAVPGATVLVLLLRPVVGAGRLLALTALTAGVATGYAAWHSPSALDWIDGVMASSLWPANHAAAVLWCALAAAAAAAVASGGKVFGRCLARLLGVVAAALAALWLAVPWWNPCNLQPWTEVCGNLWNLHVADDGSSWLVGVSGRRPVTSQVTVDFEIKTSWLLWLLKLALWLVCAVTAFSVMALGVMGLATACRPGSGAGLLPCVGLISALAGLALLGVFLWYASNGCDFGDCLIWLLDHVQALVVVAGTVALPALGLGALGAATSGRVVG